MPPHGHILIIWTTYERHHFLIRQWVSQHHTSLMELNSKLMCTMYQTFYLSCTTWNKKSITSSQEITHSTNITQFTRTRKKKKGIHQMINIISKDTIINNTQTFFIVKLPRVHSQHCKLQISLFMSKHNVSVDEQKLGRWATYGTKIPISIWSIWFPKHKQLLLVIFCTCSQDKSNIRLCAYSWCNNMSKIPTTPLWFTSLEKRHKDLN